MSKDQQRINFLYNHRVMDDPLQILWWNGSIRQSMTMVSCCGLLIGEVLLMATTATL